MVLWMHNKKKKKIGRMIIPRFKNYKNVIVSKKIDKCIFFPRKLINKAFCTFVASVVGKSIRLCSEDSVLQKEVSLFYDSSPQPRVLSHCFTINHTFRDTHLLVRRFWYTMSQGNGKLKKVTRKIRRLFVFGDFIR